MTRDEVLKEMVRVAEALERPGLKPEQILRGKAKYDELQARLNEIDAQEKAKKEKGESPEYPEHIKKHVDKIRETLAKKA